MSTDSVLSRLAEFSPTDNTVRLVGSVLSAVPGSPTLEPYPALASVVAALGSSDVAAATPHLHDEAVTDILWMSGLIDTGDRGYAVVTGVASALKMFFGGGTKMAALETDTQQRNDAVLKAFALAYLAWKTTDGPIPQRAATFAKLPAGRALLTYYAAMEVALPFADNALVSGGTMFSELMDKHGNAQLARFTSMIGSKASDGVPGALSALTGPIESAIASVRPHAQKIAASAKQYAPTALDAGDKLAGVLANVADVMPVYRYLGGRLAAESVVLRGGSLVLS